MSTKTKQRDDHNTVRLPEELTDEMDKLIGTHGFRSRAEIAKEAIRAFLEKYQKEIAQLPRFEHFNMGATGVRISDRKLKRIADIDFKPEGIYCQLDETNDCEHIQFALTVPEIKAIINKHIKEGWNLPDP
jgi:Arc/MetJ-type ribon-helix-helix transcriptional regulator